MKKKLMKRIVPSVAFAVVLSAALAGCSQPAEVSSRSESQSGSASVAVPSSSEGRQAVPSSEEELEDEQTASVISEGNETPSDIDDGTGAANTSIQETTPPETPTELDVNAAASSAGPSSAPEYGGLSGVDLNVQFGDDGAPFVLHLYDNETAAAIAGYVGTADWRLPIYHYEGYDNWEVMQYYDIPSRYEIPSDPQSVTSEKAGTIYYSEPNRIVLFFGDANVSSEYTPVGYIDYSQEFVDAVENNPVLEGWGNKIVKISG